MTKYALIVDDEQLAHLRDVMILNVSEVSHDHAEAMKNTSDKLGAQTTRVVFMRATVILAMMDSPAVVDEERASAVVQGMLPYTQAELQGVRDAGLNPERELGPYDQRSFTPACVHGRRFTEPCERCEHATVDAPLPL